MKNKKQTDLSNPKHVDRVFQHETITSIITIILVLILVIMCIFPILSTGQETIQELKQELVECEYKVSQPQFNKLLKEVKTNEEEWGIIYDTIQVNQEYNENIIKEFSLNSKKLESFLLWRLKNDIKEDENVEIFYALDFLRNLTKDGEYNNIIDVANKGEEIRAELLKTKEQYDNKTKPQPSSEIEDLIFISGVIIEKNNQADYTIILDSGMMATLFTLGLEDRQVGETVKTQARDLGNNTYLETQELFVSEVGEPDIMQLQEKINELERDLDKNKNEILLMIMERSKK